MLADMSYCNVLDAKCKSIREENEARTKVAALTKQVEQSVAELDKVNANETKVEGEREKLDGENALIKKNVKNLRRAMSEKDDEVAELKRQRDTSNHEAEKWRTRAERTVSNYLKSEDYQMKLADAFHQILLAVTLNFLYPGKP